GRFLNPVQQRYVEKLLATFPPELNTIYFVNSGSEANDLALRIARAANTATRPLDVAILDVAYHGHTQALLDISPYKWYQAVDGLDYQPASTHVLELPDSFRGKHRGGQTEEVGALYAAEMEDLVGGQDGGVGVFIAESILGCGGQVVPPPGYLRRCYAAVRKAGGVCIADEVQTGFARPGSSFWMFQEHGVVPDIVTFGKPMGNGYPVAAVVCRRSVADKFAQSGIEYFNTFGGNSVACAIAEAVLDTIQLEGLQQNALLVGRYLTAQLLLLKDQYLWVGDVRGSGLFQGIEIVHSRTSADLQPYPELTKFLVDYLRYQHVLVSRDGPDENVIKIKPPLVFSKENVDTLVGALREGLACATRLNIF
ncbi:pyridoxal phosphate-dependent transferase, partial [Ochromonadaceae sp. CCMP2298]